MLDWRRPFYYLLGLAARLLQRGEAWFFTRTVRWLVQGLPALFVAGTCVTLLASNRGAPRTHVLDRYNAAIDEAIKNSDFETAELFLHKLMVIDESRLDVRFRLASLAEQSGDSERAEDLMSQLAPETKEAGYGHPAAHFWKAKKWLAEHEKVSIQQTAPLVHHLEGSLQGNTNNVEAHALLGQVLYANREFDKAASQLGAIVDTEPRWRNLLAKCYLAQGKPANRELMLAREYFESRILTDPGDTDARIHAAEAWALQGQFDTAERVLREGFALEGGSRCREAVAAIYLARFDMELQRGKGEVIPLELLEQAVRVAPNHLEALTRLAKYLDDEGAEGEVARRAIDLSLSSGSAPARLHLILGTSAAGRGNLELAEFHLEQARILDSSSYIVFNNLAWVVAHQEPPQLEYALELANMAVDRAPNHPEVRETRGQILALMGRNDEAMGDLEMALGMLKGNAKLHLTVADIYDRLNLPEMAQLHRREAEAATKGTTEPPRDNDQ